MRRFFQGCLYERNTFNVCHFLQQKKIVGPPRETLQPPISNGHRRQLTVPVQHIGAEDLKMTHLLYKAARRGRCRGRHCSLNMVLESDAHSWHPPTRRTASARGEFYYWCQNRTRRRESWETADNTFLKRNSIFFWHKKTLEGQLLGMRGATSIFIQPHQLCTYVKPADLCSPGCKDVLLFLCTAKRSRHFRR